MTTQHEMMDKEYLTLLNTANEAVQKNAPVANQDPHRLKYHICSPSGWINDPNGLIYFKGEYHVFYQLHPYSPEWGPMHWGHVKSKDLVHWEHTPIALAPSEFYDKDGCFSGSAVDDDGVLTLIYTGHVNGKPAKQVQCIATSTDGLHFTKYNHNPVISVPPEQGSPDFRDPKVWRHAGQWFMVVGSGKDGRGNALLYKSADLVNWTFIGVSAQSDGWQGAIWECPDLFSLEDRHVLITSPIGMDSGKTLYIIGDMNYVTGELKTVSSRVLDYGFDFYAPQTFQDSMGRRILIGWMDAWDASVRPTQQYGWAGAMTIPRELKIVEGVTLCMNPIEELQQLRGRYYSIEPGTISSECKNLSHGLDGDCLEIIVVFDLSDCDAKSFGLKLRYSEELGEETNLFYDVQRCELVFDRNKSGAGDGGVRRVYMAEVNHTLKLHIFLDRSSVEVFANNGRTVMTNRIYPSPASLGLCVFATNGKVRIMSLSIWELQSIWAGNF